MKAKYRIVAINDTYKFKIQKKTFLFWDHVTFSDSLSDAEKILKDYIRSERKHPTGSVVKEYSEADLLIDTLKGESLALARKK